MQEWRGQRAKRIRTQGPLRRSKRPYRAFDTYKSETLRRLEEEQNNFEAFLERLREAKDKAEFDEFMEERAKNAASSHDDEAEEDAPKH